MLLLTQCPKYTSFHINGDASFMVAQDFDAKVMHRNGHSIELNEDQVVVYCTDGNWFGVVDTLRLVLIYFSPTYDYNRPLLEQQPFLHIKSIELA